MISPLLDPSRKPLNALRGLRRKMAHFIPSAGVHTKGSYNSTTTRPSEIRLLYVTTGGGHLYRAVAGGWREPKSSSGLPMTAIRFYWRQEPTQRLHARLGRQRYDQSPVRRIVQEHGQHRYRARAVSRLKVGGNYLTN